MEAPTPTAPHAHQSLENLIDEAGKIATENQKTIQQIKASNKFQFYRYHVEVKKTIAGDKLELSGEEKVQTYDFEGLRKDWRFPLHCQLESIAPDLFRDGIHYECTCLDDVIMVNDKMLEACKKYWFLDEVKAIPFILKFIKNFIRLRDALDHLKSKYVEPESRLDLVRERLTSINIAITTLIQEAPITFFKGAVFEGGSILDAAMKSTLSTLFDGEINFKLLTTSQIIGVSAAAFDSNIMNKGPFLLVIKSVAGHVFGAFIPDDFGSKSGWHPCSSGLFMFALGNVTKKPFKVIPKAGITKMHYSSCGMHLGEKGGMVCFCSNSCGDLTEEWTLSTEFSYDGPLTAGALAGQSGTPAFSPEVVEIFTVQK